MRSRFLPLLVLMTMIAAGATAEAVVDPTKLLAQVDAQRFVPDMNFTLSLTAYDGEAVVDESTLWGWIRSTNDGTKALLAFVQPSTVKGRKMLMDGSTVYLQFPKTRNPIRLSPLQVLMGQTSNGDVARTSFSQDYDAASVETDTVAGRDCWAFSLSAKEGKQATAYRKIRLWVEKATLSPLAADFFGSGDALLKHADYGDYRSVAGKSVAFRLTVADGSNPTKRTVMQYEKVGTQALSAGSFRKDYLESWNPEAPR